MSEDLQKKIAKQVEYYFSDINLARDNHLRELIKNSTDGWITYEELLKFPRLKLLSEDSKVIQEALKSSDDLEVNDSGVKRKSNEGLPNFDEVKEKYKDRSVYIKGFKRDENIDEIMKYVETNGGPTINIHMRKISHSKTFKGSVFVIFKEVEDSKKFLECEEAKKFKGTEMTRLWQSEYFAQKQKEVEEKREHKKKKKESIEAQFELQLASRMTKGALMEFSGLKVIDTADFDEKTVTTNMKQHLCEILVDIAEVSWVDYFPATGKAIIRLKQENTAEASKAKLYGENESFTYDGCTVNIEIVTDEKEKEYWRTVLMKQDNKKRSHRSGGNNGPSNKKRRQ